MANTERFEKVDIGKLVPYARNARTHSKEQIAQLRSSLREFGFVSPVIIDNNYNIIAGHGRVVAAKEEGYKTVPCVFAENLTEAQKRAYILADNRLAMNAGWDEEMLAVELSDLQADAFDVSLLGFTDAELNKLSGAAENVKEDDFDVDEELKKPAVTKLGDLWLLGNHRLVCGDSTKADTFTLLMDGKLANLTVTDPPYNVNYEGSAGKIQNDNMADDKFYEFLFDAFANTEKAMAQDASIYIFHADTEGLNFRRAFSDAGFYLSGTAYTKAQKIHTNQVHGEGFLLRQGLRRLCRQLHRKPAAHQRPVVPRAIRAHRLAGADRPGCVRCSKAQRLPSVQHRLCGNSEEDGQVGTCRRHCAAAHLRRR